MPKSELKYLVPNICATIPLVGGTVDNQKSPKVIPKIIEFSIDGGENIKTHILNDYNENKLQVQLLSLQQGTTQDVNTMKPTKTCR